MFSALQKVEKISQTNGNRQRRDQGPKMGRLRDAVAKNFQRRIGERRAGASPQSAVVQLHEQSKNIFLLKGGVSKKKKQRQKNSEKIVK